MEGLRVLRVVTRLNFGGPARHVTILDAGLRERRSQTMLVFGHVGEQEGSLEVLVEAHGLRSMRLAHLGRRIRPWSDLVTLVHLTRLVFRERPDIVHTHTAKAGALGRLAAVAYNSTRRSRHRCLVVHTFHGHVMEGYFNPLGSAAVRIIERTLARATDLLVTLSARQRQDIVERLAIAPARKVVVVPLGLDLDGLLALDVRSLADKAHFGFAADDVVFGYVGRFVPIKDLQTLLRAFARLAATSDRARLLMVGDGECRVSLEALAGSLGVADKVQFVGWQSSVTQVYGAVDVAVLSSLNEGTPVAIIEAMAAGLPVVATSVGGVPDVVRDGLTGSLVPERSPERLAAAMRTLAGDPGLRRRMGDAARLDARNRFGAERLVSTMATLYADRLARKRGTT